VVGAVAAPALDEIYDAAEGAGARMNGEEIHVDQVASLEEATVTFPGVRDFSEVGLAGFFAKLTHRCWRSRGFGDFWGHMLVARGAVHVMVDPVLSVWDVAALEPIVTESGGKLTRLDGEPWTDQQPCLTTNGALHDAVIALTEPSSGS
jgi:histidinol-phosphatase